MARHRDFKDALYAELARLGRAVGSPQRLEMLELLAQGERTVESLASETGLSLANASQHLQILKRAALVESRRQGLFAYYRLADPDVFELCDAVRRVAERRLAEVERLVRRHFGDRSSPELVQMRELLRRVRSGGVIVLDARPAAEFRAGHIAGALSVPVEELQSRLGSLPADMGYVAYCRGPYCVYADRAVELLRRNGRRAQRLLEGFPEWRAAGYPVARGEAPSLPRGRMRRTGARQPRPRGRASA